MQEGKEVRDGSDADARVPRVRCTGFTYLENGFDADASRASNMYNGDFFHLSLACREEPLLFNLVSILDGLPFQRCLKCRIRYPPTCPGLS